MPLNSTAYQNNIRTISGSTIIYNDDVILVCNTSAGAVSFSLLEIPANYWSTTYKLYVVDSGNASSNNITINAGSGQKINGQDSYVINTNNAYALIQISGNGKYVVSSSQEGGSVIPFEGTNWSFVYGNGTHSNNATQLQNAYDAAKLETPNGSPLSANNRFTIMVGAGYYDFAANFTMDTQFIDLVSISGNSDVVFSGVGTINVTANNVKIVGVDTQSKKFTIATSLSSLECVNCKGGDESFGGGLIVSGTFTNCTGGSNSFGGLGGTASGTFTNCTGGQYSFAGAGGIASGTFDGCISFNYAFGGGGGGDASGTFINCRALVESFGGGDLGTASGTFTNCQGTTGSFGGYGSATGTFNNCLGGADAFGGGDLGNNLASGTFNNCVAGSNAFGGGDNIGGTASGTFNNCIGGAGSFGGGQVGVGSGTFFNCKGGDESFGNFTCSGSFNNCEGGNQSFGGYPIGGTLTGKLYWCRLTSGIFQTVSGGGRTIYCIDGNNATNNQ